jgi:hypothetical protein
LARPPEAQVGDLVFGLRSVEARQQGMLDPARIDAARHEQLPGHRLPLRVAVVADHLQRIGCAFDGRKAVGDVAGAPDGAAAHPGNAGDLPAFAQLVFEGEGAVLVGSPGGRLLVVVVRKVAGEGEKRPADHQGGLVNVVESQQAVVVLGRQRGLVSEA